MTPWYSSCPLCIKVSILVVCENKETPNTQTLKRYLFFLSFSFPLPFFVLLALLPGSWFPAQFNFVHVLYLGAVLFTVAHLFAFFFSSSFFLSKRPDSSFNYVLFFFLFFVELICGSAAEFSVRRTPNEENKMWDTASVEKKKKGKRIGGESRIAKCNIGLENLEIKQALVSGRGQNRR